MILKTLSTSQPNNQTKASKRTNQPYRKHFSVSEANGVTCPRSSLHVLNLTNGVPQIMLVRVLVQGHVQSHAGAVGRDPNPDVVWTNGKRVDQIFEEGELSIELVLPNAEGRVQEKHHVCHFFSAFCISCWKTTTTPRY